ncbi:putative reverse transcriptase domain-containing protein [Tanacetum coccineum]
MAMEAKVLEVVSQDLCALLFATCTLHGVALTWWKSHVKTVGHDAAYGMPWNTLMKMMTAKDCPLNEIKKLEMEIWELKVKGTDLASYTQCFQELDLLCGRMFPEESDKIKRYVSGLPDMIHRSVMTSKPKTMQDAIELVTELIDKNIHTFVKRQTENKRKFEDTSRNNQNQQQQNKRQNTGRAYTAGPNKKREYGGSLPKCFKSSGNANIGNNQRTTEADQRGNSCYEYGAQGYFKRECPKLKNNNCGNQGGNGDAPAKVYVVGNAGTNPDSKVVMGTFLLNNRYASILFDTSADRSFVSTTFSSLIDITPTTLDHYYDVELADGKIIRINTIIRGCTLNLLNHPFIIDLMPVELGSFDFIISMDWLVKYHAVIVCDEKLVRIPFGNETLIVRGYHQLRVREEDILNMEFKTRYGHYEFQNKKEHEEHLKAIQELLKKEELYAKFFKCEFWIPKVQFLGYVINSQGIHMDPAKIESIKDWASSKTPMEIRQFVGVKFDWGDKEEASFQLIKQKLCSTAILVVPEGSEDFVVYCDASHKGLGAVLMQSENHKSLQHILDQKKLNMRQHCWLELLSDYYCEIRYHPRKTNVVANALSRKEWNKPLRVRALVMTIGLNLPKQILEAQIEA